MHFVENRLFPNTIQYGIFHQFTGEVLELKERVRLLLLAAKLGNPLSLSEEDLRQLGADGTQLRELLQKEFLLSDDRDPLRPFLEQYVARPRQNPALGYRLETGEISLVRTSMKRAVYSPGKDELPAIVEEHMTPLSAEIFLLADGTLTLGEIFERQDKGGCKNLVEDRGFRETLEFLSDPERQLIKFTAQPDDLANPFQPVNLVPRDLYHASKWSLQSPDLSADLDFHLHGIDDASWEFDLIEPTVNHGLRFPSEVLGGLDYGSRFCLAALCPDVLPLLAHSDRLEVLEVGGGTGTFARSFIHQAHTVEAAAGKVTLNYHILDLSPALMRSQRALLSDLLPAGKHFQQDATAFNLPGHKFDLIVANEVVADFPVAAVRRDHSNDSGCKDSQGAGQSVEWQGEGAGDVQKYNLADEAAPDFFLVNSGAFRFIERAWEHLAPGGTLIISEYGAAGRYPEQSHHLNHEEFSIHFGHLAACAHKVGFQSRLLTLKEFLALDDQVLVLDGREEHLMCLNHVLEKFGVTLPYAVITKTEFETRCQGIAERTGLTGFSFSPLWRGYHFGPRISDFMMLIMNKPW